MRQRKHRSSSIRHLSYSCTIKHLQLVRLSVTIKSTQSRLESTPCCCCDSKQKYWWRHSQSCKLNQSTRWNVMFLWFLFVFCVFKYCSSPHASLLLHLRITSRRRHKDLNGAPPPSIVPLQTNKHPQSYQTALRFTHVGGGSLEIKVIDPWQCHHCSRLEYYRGW